jgi:hypothetical protein
MRTKVPKVAIIHRTHVFQTRGFLIAIPSHGGNFDLPFFPSFLDPAAPLASFFVSDEAAILTTGSTIRLSR